MGTQSSYGGPGDRSPLLPTWALDPAGSAPAVTPPAPPQQPEVTPAPSSTTPPPDTQGPPGTPVVPSVAQNGSWQRARRSFNRAVSSGSRESFRKSARDYVRASRGASGAARSSSSGKRVTAAFSGFLSSAAGAGLQAALRSIGIGDVLGRDVSEVLAAISNALAPDGASKEEVAARDAVNETLEHLSERFIDEGRDLTALESMTPQDIAAAIEYCVGAYVYNRWLGDLGAKIEQGDVKPTEAVRVEREMRDFIRETVRFDLSRIDVMRFDWRGEPGRQVVETIYRDAYSLFGGEA